MKILDLQTGSIHEYGTNGHDSLYVSNDGRYLTYYNLQNGDGSGVGDYRFVCEDDKVPAESETAAARYCEVYFNIGGWHDHKPKWIPTSEMLPEEYDSYLIMWRHLTEGYPDRLFYEICEYEPEVDEWERIEQAGDAGAEIVAWMPLPEPYEPKEKENG